MLVGKSHSPNDPLGPLRLAAIWAKLVTAGLALTSRSSAWAVMAAALVSTRASLFVRLRKSGRAASTVLTIFSSRSVSAGDSSTCNQKPLLSFGIGRYLAVFSSQIH